jgi:hypothetical protein
MTLDQVKALCVSGFSGSARREVIFAGMAAFLKELSTAGVLGRVWIDGSFVTKKLEPGDCDLVVSIDGVQVLDSGNPVLAEFLRRHFDTERARVKAVHHCDVYCFPDFPLGHPLHSVTTDRSAYWQKQFGFDRSSRPKGMAVVTLPV